MTGSDERHSLYCKCKTQLQRHKPGRLPKKPPQGFEYGQGEYCITLDTHIDSAEEQREVKLSSWSLINFATA